jgi:hypothetical protein
VNPNKRIGSCRWGSFLTPTYRAVGKRRVSIVLEVNNQSPSANGLCNAFSSNLIKTVFRLKADGAVFENKFPIYKWPSIKTGSSGRLELLYEIPENANDLVLMGDTDQEVLGSWQLQK